MHQLQPGVSGGLLLIVNLAQRNYDPDGLHADLLPAGVSLTFHTDNVIPDLADHAHIAGPGQLTRFAIEKSELFRAKYPYKDNCTENSLLATPTHRCLRNCMIEQMLAKCKAVDVRTALEAYNHAGEELPTPRDNATQSCVENFMDHYLQVEDTCHCPVGCHEVMYKVHSTKTKWPSDVTLPHWIDKARMIAGNENVTGEYILKNYVAIQIYYNNFLVATTRRIGAYDVNAFLSDLGGQLGLWIGASVYSIMEIFSFLIEIVLYHLFLKKKLKNGSAPDNNNKGDNVSNTGGDDVKRDTVDKGVETPDVVAITDVPEMEITSDRILPTGVATDVPTSLADTPETAKKFGLLQFHAPLDDTPPDSNPSNTTDKIQADDNMKADVVDNIQADVDNVQADVVKGRDIKADDILYGGSQNIETPDVTSEQPSFVLIEESSVTQKPIVDSNLSDMFDDSTFDPKETSEQVEGPSTRRRPNVAPPYIMNLSRMLNSCLGNKE